MDSKYSTVLSAVSYIMKAKHLEDTSIISRTQNYSRIVGKLISHTIYKSFMHKTAYNNSNPAKTTSRENGF